MASLGKFAALREKFSHLADFVTIYIEEAHPAEKGHFTDNLQAYGIITHENMEARVGAAGVLREEAGETLAGSPILVDPMDDRANLAYAAFPERLYVVVDGVVEYQGGLGPFNYNISELEEFLDKRKYTMPKSGLSFWRNFFA